ncbi:MAG TPA: N-acetylglucosamine-6-phosphate deacetylase [Stellaceae bacterium]|nr:N-acetylglucosamine-6-phosphate deacetylase [Stellaceae bacterium]
MSGKAYGIAADTVFDGVRTHRGCAVVVEGELIAALLPRRDLPADMPVRDLPDGAWLAPGFIDIQVNGGGGVLFNDAPTGAAIAAIAAAHRRFGTTALLPTLISDSRDKMAAARAAVAVLLGRHPGVLGIHFEGPFLAPERRGVHDLAALRRPESEDLPLLASLPGGVTLVTLAPERVPPGFIASLAGAGVKVVLGHSAASYEETRAALSEGLTGFTHLFNAMPPLSARSPGPVAAALESEEAFYGLIVDGVHVAPAMLRLALRGRGRPMLVTDAMPPVGGTKGGFMLYGEPVAVRDGACKTAAGMLAGSALDMASAVRNCVRLLALPLETALSYASLNPAVFLGLDGRLGKLAPGCRADLVALDPQEIRVFATWVAGQGEET